MSGVRRAKGGRVFGVSPGEVVVAGELGAVLLQVLGSVVRVKAPAFNAPANCVESGEAKPEVEGEGAFHPAPRTLALEPASLAVLQADLGKALFESYMTAD